MKPFDVALVAFVLVSALRGWGRGLVGLAAGLAGFIIAVIIARATYVPLAAYLDNHFGFAKAVQATLLHVIPAGSLLVPGVSQHITLTTAAVVSAIAFLAIMFVSEAVLGIAAGFIGSVPNAIPMVGTVNRLMGAVFATLEAFVIAAAVLLLLEPLAHAGALGALSPYVVQAPLSHQLWLAAEHFAPFLKNLP